MRAWRNGRRKGLKIPRLIRAGSSPAARTKWSSSLTVERSDLYPEAQIRDRSRFESEEDHQILRKNNESNY